MKEKSIINDFLRKHQEDSLKEVESMKQLPLSVEEMLAQMRRNHEMSVRGMRETKNNNLSKRE